MVGVRIKLKSSNIVEISLYFPTGKDIFGKDGKYQSVMQKIELPIVEHAECQSYLRKTRLGLKYKLDESFICAGGEAGRDTVIL